MWKIPRKLITAGRVVEIRGGMREKGEKGEKKYIVRFFTKDLETGVNPAHERWAEEHFFPPNNGSPVEVVPAPKGGFQYNDSVTVAEAGKVVRIVKDTAGNRYTDLMYSETSLEPAYGTGNPYSNVPRVHLSNSNTEANNNARNRRGNRRTVRIGPVPNAPRPRAGSTARFGMGALREPAPRSTTTRRNSPAPRKPAIRRHSTAGFGTTMRVRRNRGGTVVSPKNVGL